MIQKLTPLLFAAKSMGSLYELPGVYELNHPKIKDYIIKVIASNGMEFDHVSVTLHQFIGKKGLNSIPVKRTPTWGEMSYVKDVFFDPEEWVIQYHPAHSEYVNNHQYCLHLWRPHTDFPKPTIEMVGSEVSGKPNYQI